MYFILAPVFLVLFLEKASASSLADQLCRKSDSLFCSHHKNSTVLRQRTLRNETSENEEEIYLRLAREVQDDPSCPRLKAEYETVCFTIPPVQALLETKAFCDAFVEMCPHLLKTNLFTKIKGFRVDFARYCKKQKERFEYVCPDPLRFQSYAEDAVEYCIRYKDRCPDAHVPSKPVPYKKSKDRIWTREIKQFCDKLANFAANYCTNPDLLRVPKYQLPCGLYKYQCVDIYTRVIYGWG